LKKESERNPGEPRTAFYLAQTADCLGLWQEAEELYKRRIALEGFAEERYESAMRIARIRKEHGHKDPTSYWMRAAKISENIVGMQRAEPFYLAAHHWRTHGAMSVAYGFARTAWQFAKKGPPPAILHIDQGVYEWCAADEMAATAWMFGNWSEGLIAAEAALAGLKAPESDIRKARLLENVRFYRAENAKASGQRAGTGTCQK
jgi:hypothetical protein